MTVVNKKEPVILGLVDVLLLALSLIGTLILRYQSMPSKEMILSHLYPFTIIFAYSIVSFYITGLYGRAISSARHTLPVKIIKSQIANALIAVAIFYFVPNFTVSPKITLLLYIILSSVFILFVRMNTYSILNLRKKQPSLVIGDSVEVDEIIAEMNRNPHSLLFCKNKFNPDNSEDSIKEVLSDKVYFRYVIADVDDSRVEKFLPEIYKNLFPNSSIINLHDLYEDVFDRIPLSRINYTWIMTHISSISPKVYDMVKRLVDILLAGIVLIFAIILYPFVAIAIKIEDGGSILIKQKRIGVNGKIFNIYKFRSMTRSDGGQWLPESENKVTKVGMFIRKTRIDELPQALSVILGDMSLIGPRADIIDLGERLQKEIPYYSIRTAIKPGLSGWAQVNQEKPPQSVEETKIRLSYDLYYIKYRSLSLDLLITLRTIKTLLSREGM
jgi:lipopolysaccharide/colanic/teichoic acid biosynthesis glycosyltransferase